MATWSKTKTVPGGRVCVYRLTERMKKLVEDRSQARLKTAMRCIAPSAFSCRGCKEYKRCAVLYRQARNEEMNARLRGQWAVLR